VREHGHGTGDGSGDVDVRCSLPAHLLPRGAAFTVIEVHATTSLTAGIGGRAWPI